MGTSILVKDSFGLDYLNLNTQVFSDKYTYETKSIKYAAPPTNMSYVLEPYETWKNQDLSLFIHEHTIANVTLIKDGKLSLVVEKDAEIFDDNDLKAYKNLDPLAFNLQFDSETIKLFPIEILFNSIYFNSSELSINAQARSFSFSEASNDFSLNNDAFHFLDEKTLSSHKQNFNMQIVLDEQSKENGFVGKDEYVKPNEESASHEPLKSIEDITPVTQVNHSPYAETFQDFTIEEDSAFHLNLGSHFTDINVGDKLTYTATLSNGSELPDWLHFNGVTGLLTGNPENDNVGDLQIILTASDSFGSQSSTPVNIHIENTNDAPTVTAIENTNVAEDSNLTYDVSGHFSDADAGDSLTFSLSEDTLALLTINPTSGVISGTPENEDVGTTQVRVTATDTEGQSASGAFEINVENTNDAAIATEINLVNIQSNSNIETDISSHFIDPDVGDNLTYSISGDAPSWLNIDTNSGVLSGNTVEANNNSHSVEVRATDNQGSSATANLNINLVQEIESIEGTQGKDILIGDSGDQAFHSYDGKDTIYGDSSGNINGGHTGDDTIYAGDGGNTIYGDAKNMLLDGALAGDDVIHSGSGNDKIYGDAGNMLKDGSIGGDDEIHAGGGDDVIYGDAGNQLHGTSHGGNDTIYGDSGNDTIYGDAGHRDSSAGGDDNLFGGAGNDTIYGDSGNDYIDGGTGSDSVYGDAGNDTMVYDATDIIIDGGTGHDTLIVESGGLIHLNNVSHIENVGMDNGLSNSINITANDVLNIGATDNTIIFQGDSFDIITLDEGHWVQNDSAAPLPAGASEGDYHTYVSSDNGVIVQIESTVHVVVNEHG